MANLVLAFGELLAGAVIADAAIKGDSIANVVKGTATTHKITGLGGPGDGSTAPSGSGTLSTAGAKAGGFLAATAKYVSNRADQGRDGLTDPGGPIIAPGDGTVLRVGSDPGGFGPNYPIVHFDTGPYAGKDLYVGHTHSALAAGAKFKAGQILSHTGTSGVGNATQPGWFEIGYAPGGSPGRFGQPTPFP